MINDEDTHIRRNIVVVSAGILLAAYLELPAAWLLAAVLPKDMPPIEQYKFWAVGFAILLYFGLRYKFSQEGEDSLGALTKQTNLFKYDAMRASLRLPENGIVTYAHAKKILPELEECILEVLENYPNNRDDFAIPEPNVLFSNIFWLKEKKTLSVTASVLFTHKAGPPVTLPINRQTLVIWPKSVSAIRFTIPANLRSWFYSASSIRNLTPLVLAIIAEAVLMFRFSVAFWNV